MKIFSKIFKSYFLRIAKPSFLLYNFAENPYERKEKLMKYIKLLSLLLTMGTLLSSCSNATGTPDKKNTDVCEEGPSPVPEITDRINSFVKYDGSLTLTLPESPVVPYHKNAQKYLEKENAKVQYYADSSIKNPGVDTLIEWQCERDDVLTYVVEYSLNEDFSDAIWTEVIDGNSYAINNLYKGSKYYVRVSAHCTSGIYGATGSFETTDVGPRVMTVDGIYNVRDIGGYKTDSGKVTLQGMIYRGGQMNGTYVDKPVNITEAGKLTMNNIMHVRYDMDLRGANEQQLPLESPLPAVPIKRYGFAGYNTQIQTEAGRENLRAVFSDLADPDIYPIYVHCQGGADRTGVLCFMINALLGVDKSDIIRDYEFTTFSLYGTRSTTQGAYLPYQDNIRKLINGCEGETLKEKVENLLLGVGVTPEEIASIRRIMLG